jgi:hypothetical protein
MCASTNDVAPQPFVEGLARNYGSKVGSLPLHVVEHASQIRQFLTAAGVKVRPLPGDRFAG